MACAKLETRLNKLAAPTIAGLGNAIGHAIAPFTPNKCRNDFKAPRSAFD